MIQFNWLRFYYFACWWVSPRAKCQRSSTLPTLQYLTISLRELTEQNTSSAMKICQLHGVGHVIGLHSWLPYASEKSSPRSSRYKWALLASDARDSIQFNWNLWNCYNWFIKSSWFTKYRQYKEVKEIVKGNKR